MSVADFFQDNRGIALVITLLIVSLILFFTLNLRIDIHADLDGTANLKDSIRLSYMARSVFNQGLAILIKDAQETSVDSLLEDWAKVRGVYVSRPFFPDGRARLRIEDHSGRIQVNHLIKSDGDFDPIYRSLMKRFLKLPQFKLSPEEINGILSALKDWMDPDHKTTPAGAEEAYYQSLERPYHCKDGPLDSLRELLLVKGITPELFYGTPKEPGISRYLTVWGEGKININTADTLVLKVLAEGIEEEMAREMDVYRRDPGHDLSDPTWYKDIPWMTHITIDSSLITTVSNCFEITAEAYTGKMERRVTGVVLRKGKIPELLSFKVE